MKTKRWVFYSIVVIGLILLGAFGVTKSNFFQKPTVPPHELFAEAEKLRKSGALLEAAIEYDTFLDHYKDSELAPTALYYSGACKYTLSTYCLGKNEFEQRKGGLSDIKKRQYQDCLRYMNKQGEAFLYDKTSDKYLYTGREFAQLLKAYPSSDFVDEAAFQLIRTAIVTKQHTNALTVPVALQLYAEFFQKYPQSKDRQQGVDDLLQILSARTEPLGDHKAIADAYREILPLVETLPELSKVSYLLGKKVLEEGDAENAAILLGVPSLVGRGLVNTQQTRLNIRKGPGTNQKIIDKAEKGEELLVLESKGEWYQVKLQNGTVGYAHRDFVQVIGK